MKPPDCFALESLDLGFDFSISKEGLETNQEAQFYESLTFLARVLVVSMEVSFLARHISPAAHLAEVLDGGDSSSEMIKARHGSLGHLNR